MVRSSPAHPRAARARPAPGPAKGDEYRRPASWAQAAGVGSGGEQGGSEVRAPAAQQAEVFFAPRTPAAVAAPR